MMYTQYFSRWNNVLNPELRPKSWTYEEDKELLKLIQVYGIGESAEITINPWFKQYFIQIICM